MNMQNLMSGLSQNLGNNSQGNQDQNAGPRDNPLSAIGSMLPGGLAGGAAAGGLMALLMGSKSTRKMATKVAKYGGTAVLGGLAYKAYDNWKSNKPIDQTQSVSANDIERMGTAAPQFTDQNLVKGDATPLHMVLIMAMVSASKADGDFDAHEQRKMFDAIEKLNLNSAEKAQVFDLMSRDITIQEIADAVTVNEHKSEVYLSAYLAIEVDDERERAYLNNLAIALDLPQGFPAYLEQQADQGVSD